MNEGKRCKKNCSPNKGSIAQERAATRLPSIETIAGGIEGGIGVQTFEILRTRMDRVALVDDSQIRAAMRWMLGEHQYLVEPTAAAVVSACLTGKVGTVNGPSVVKGPRAGYRLFGALHWGRFARRTRRLLSSL